MSVVALAGCQSRPEYQKPYVFQSDCAEAREASVMPLTFVVDKNLSQASVNGEICSGSYQAFQSMTEFYPDIKLLRLQNVPGSLDDETNLRLATKIHDMGISTQLESDSKVESGGTDLFLSGVERKVEQGAKVGVHSWARDDGNGKIVEGADVPAEAPQHQKYIDYYHKVELSKPEEFYWFTIYSASSDDMHYLSQDELKYFGVNTPTFAF
ncbi:hypothetical protein KO511_11825 [Vibrio hepatarius]|nr:hypothetical protein [Vibrio hepatarius]